MSDGKFPESIEAVQQALAAHDYVAERSLATTIFLALRMRRPLFLEGEPGVGKTEVAKVLARMLRVPLIRLQCYEGLDVHTAVYEWNYARQLLEIRLAEASGQVDRNRLLAEIFSPDFLIARPLLQAVQQSRDGQAPVLLIDELDRSDEGIRGVSAGAAFGFSDLDSRAGHRARRGAAGRRDHVEPHARDSRRAQAPVPLLLGRISVV